MTDYWSGSITFTGLGSGMDFDSIIEANMTMESYRLNQMEEWKAEWEEKVDLLEELNTALKDYYLSLESMDTLGEFLIKDAQSTDSSLLGVSADSDALEGSHTVIIDQLAANDLHTSTTGFASSDDVVCTSDEIFRLTYAGESMEVTIPANTTVQGMVNIINNSSEFGGDVRAKLINDGSEYHMQIQGMDLGEDNVVVIEDTGFTGFLPTDFVNTQAAQNSRIKVDGYPPGAADWIERDANYIDDVIDGVSLTLYGPTDSEGEIVTVSTNSDEVIANVESFVEQTNTIRQIFLDLEDDGDDDTEEVLSANYGVDFVEQKLESIMSTRGLGFRVFDEEAGTGDRFLSLASIGITTDSDEDSSTFGHLVIDSEELEEALEDDPDAFAKLFAVDFEGETDSSDFSFDSAIDGITEPGEYEVEYEIQGGEVVWATINGEAALVSGLNITGAGDTDASGLGLVVNNASDGTYDGTAYLKQGKILEAIDSLKEMTSSEDGYLTTIIDNYQEIVDNTEESIDQEEARLELKRQELVRKYSELEAVLTEYDGIAEELSSAIDQLE
ncbi:MAG: flagellar hook protein [Desulfovibrio sp.]|nr:MAG: flagellar hook protein [Desulfovibrio sp.]